MSNENRQEDTVLGAALGRAIETQPVRQTQFADSRLAARIAGRERRSPLLPLLAAAAAVVLGLALGSALLAQRGPGGVASSPTPAPDQSPSESVSPSPSFDLNRDRVWVYFARDQLPPVGAYIGALLGDFTSVPAERRILLRLEALRDMVEDNEVPAGTVNPVAQLNEPAPIGVRIESDVATVEFSPNTFEPVRGAANTQAVVQQLVYTITEEPGIRRVLLKERGKNELTIDQLIIDKPLTREDVAGYDFDGAKVASIENPGSDAPQEITKWSVSNSPPSGGPLGVLGRLSLEVREITPPCEAQACPPGPRLDPTFTATLETPIKECTEPSCMRGKALITLRVPDTDGTPAAQPDAFNYTSGPVRFVDSQVVTPSCGPGTTCQPFTLIHIFLDDARPWRVSVEPVGTDGARINVDVGGHPQSISESIAAYGPVPGTELGRTFTLSGAARVFEAHVAWRLKDASDREVATGFATASIGTSPVWGTFTTEVRVPDGVSGDLLLEVFWPSPQDSSDLGKVQVPIRVR